ncbi:MAG: cytochrome P450 [bacterium]|nr:cytochrome P450 [bacterium]
MSQAIPQPKGHFLLGNLNDMRRDFLQFLVETDRNYGPVSQISAGPVSMVLLSNPDDIADVLVKRGELFHKTKSTKKLLATLLGEGLISLEGANHKRHRLIMQPAFHARQVQSYTSMVVNYTQSWLKLRKEGEVLDIVPSFANLMLDVVVGTFFSTSLAQTENIRTALKSFSSALDLQIRSPIPLPKWLPTKLNRTVEHALNTLNHIVYALLKERREMRHLPPDLLTALITSVDEETGKPLTDDEIRDEIATIFFAGYETTTTTLAWIWYLLTTHPHVLDKLRTEIIQTDTTATVSRRQFPYMDAVIKETLRLYPAAWLFDREPIEDVVIGGYPIRAGQTIYISPYLVQRNPAYFDNPDAFLPERFLGDIEKRIPHFAYFPFGGGARACIGQTFALHTTTLVLTTLLPHLTFELMPDQTVVPSASATIVPKNGIMMRISHLSQPKG